jgi:hypothetical protein
MGLLELDVEPALGPVWSLERTRHDQAAICIYSQTPPHRGAFLIPHTDRVGLKPVDCGCGALVVIMTVPAKQVKCRMPSLIWGLVRRISEGLRRCALLRLHRRYTLRTVRITYAGEFVEMSTKTHTRSRARAASPSSGLGVGCSLARG